MGTGTGTGTDARVWVGSGNQNSHERTALHTRPMTTALLKQLGQLSQPNGAAACISFGKCEKRASNIALSYGGNVDK